MFRFVGLRRFFLLSVIKESNDDDIFRIHESYVDIKENEREQNGIHISNMDAEYNTYMFDDDSQVSNIELSIMKTKQLSHTDRALEELIDECNSSTIDLSHRELTDDNMKQIIDLAVRKKQCQEIKLGYNR